MDSNEIVKIAYKAADDKKGEKITVIDISNLSPIADFFMIANGDNIRQVQAIADNVTEELNKAGLKDIRTEGFRGGSWILMDCGGVIIHIFNKEDRAFYDLERMWSDGKFVEIGDL